MSRKRPLSAMNDVNTMGGREVVLNRMVNHYKAISNIKPFLKIEEPHKHVDAGKTSGNVSKKNFVSQEFYNVRETYKGVANVKSLVDSKKPNTFNMGKGIKNQKGNEKFEDFEHVRRLNAMSKRILSFGKPHERKKNINDPVSNPIYFFRKPGDENAIKLVSLDKFTKKLNKLNENNKTFLNPTVYAALNVNNSDQNNILKTENKNSIKRSKSHLNIKEKVYTHIHTDPLSMIKQHVKERIKTTKQNEEELLNLTRNSNPVHSMNKSNSSNITHILPITNLSKLSDTKVPFPMVDSSNSEKSMDFQMKIVKYIVSRRIYLEKDMDMLLKQLIHKNKNYLDQKEIVEIFDHVKDEFDK